MHAHAVHAYAVHAHIIHTHVMHVNAVHTQAMQNMTFQNIKRNMPIWFSVSRLPVICMFEYQYWNLIKNLQHTPTARADTANRDVACCSSTSTGFSQIFNGTPISTVKKMFVYSYYISLYNFMPISRGHMNKNQRRLCQHILQGRSKD